MSTKVSTKPVIHGVMDDAWARYVNDVAIDIFARSNNLVITKKVLTPKNQAQDQQPLNPPE